MAEEPLQRRLAAILSADVVGYSRLMGIDEAGTLSRLNALRRELIDPTIAAHSGRIVKLMGDGALVEFSSAVDAVTCAIEIQRKLRDHDASPSEADPIRFRIGINVGDIIIEGDDILGDGVNVAARIEGVAEPGGISISEDAWRQVQGKVAANFVDAGTHPGHDFTYEQSDQAKNHSAIVTVHNVVRTKAEKCAPTSVLVAVSDEFKHPTIRRSDNLVFQAYRHESPADDKLPDHIADYLATGVFYGATIADIKYTRTLKDG
jgi:hypothetical protein